MPIQTINPATEEVTHSYEEMPPSQVDQIIDDVHDTYLKWRETPFAERAKCMHNAAKLLRERADEYAKIITTEMGKPIASARGEIEKCAWVCEYYADNAEGMLSSRPAKTDNKKSYIAYRPLGIIFAIMPWNFPFWQVFRFAAPNLMAGNGALLSHAPICTGTALAIEQVLRDAGFPENLFRTLIMNYDTAKHTIENQKVRAVTLTGSDRAGKIVGSEAAGALKKVVLELGGSDPYIILEDADLEKAAEACVTSRLNNTGQVCIAAKRIIVVDEVREAFQKLVHEKMKTIQMDDPTDKNAKFGPMARADLRDEVHKQVMECVDKGAKILMGGEIPKRKGFYYPATLLVDVKKGMPAMDDEIFGPVVTLINAKDEAEAIAIANDSRFGLAGAVFTQNLERGERIARDKIHTGTCYVNGWVTSDPRLPFGGIKQSGYGRELATEGIHEFVNVKTVCIKE